MVGMGHLEEAAEILSQVQEDQSDSADVAAAQAALDLAVKVPRWAICPD